ncbi:Gfo/Idh/MocA family oxidoreductase [Vibrio sp. 99-70-13A1]|uniref:Gfo/Idh/MocA family protein n=1 Tax=Vibrio sp. 99-70-13A1 TaxID=2607601 RepID=UPI001493559F|nr:Gfo/Idh/MocA family oxidoreductase [Vibrio sp. 99-70-13A1]NOH98253.1 Gfo/Idh/MocA family oxidoreductase [Vibrio sp. 99-70-13A1]
MIRLAVIGTNWITQKFVQAALGTAKFELCAVYSRSLSSAKDFADEFLTASNNIHLFDSLDELAKAENVDAIYIASPNSLHAEQAMLMMDHGKHVICEKPIASNIEQALQTVECAERNQVVLFEAYKSEFLPNFKRIKAGLSKIGRLHKAHLSYCQYSSRYQKYLNGENPNTFNPQFSNGSMMDIGFYCVSAAVALFGKPTKVQASGVLLDSGVDGHGDAIFSYPEFTVTLSHSKVSDSNQPSEIQGENGSIIIDHIAECTKVTIEYRDGKTEDLSVKQAENSMSYEAEEFARRIQLKDLTRDKRALIVSEVTTEMRKQLGVHFPADDK